MTLLQGPPPIGTPATEKVGFDLLDPTTALLDPANPAVRAMFRGVSVLRLPLQAIGDGSVAPGGILGGDILRRYSVDLRFGAACATDAGLLHDDVLGAPRRGPRLPGGRRLRRDPLRALRRRRDDGGGRSGLPRAARAAGAVADAHRVPKLRRAGRILARPSAGNHVLQGGRRLPAGEGRRSRADARHRRRSAGPRPVGLGAREGKAGDGTRRDAERRAPGRGLAGPDRRHLVDAAASSRWSTTKPAPRPIPARASSSRARGASSRSRTTPSWA